MPDALSHPLIRILRFDRTDNCLSDLTSDLESLRDTSGLSEITARMANYRQFLYERSSLRLASGYKRRGFEVTFIHEGSEPRPDFKIRSYDLNRSAIFEVKHLSGRTTLETMILDVEDTISPYIVIVTTELLQLDSQAHYLAQRIAGEIQRLGSAEITYENRYVVDLGYTKFEILTKQQGNLMGPTGVMVHWGATISAVRQRESIASLITDARDQLYNYERRSINVVAIDNGNASIRNDVFQETVFTDPALFENMDYSDLSGVLVTSTIVPRADLFIPNSNNAHVKSSVVSSFSF